MGMGSNAHDLLGVDLISLSISASDAGFNEDSIESPSNGVSCSKAARTSTSPRFDRMFTILSEKNVANSSARSFGW